MTAFTVDQRVRVNVPDSFCIGHNFHNRTGTVTCMTFCGGDYIGIRLDNDGEPVRAFRPCELVLIEPISTVLLSESDVNDIRRAMCLAIHKTNDMGFIDRLTEISGRLPFGEIVSSEVSE